jgi:hypothetical protein
MLFKKFLPVTPPAPKGEHQRCKTPEVRVLFNIILVLKCATQQKLNNNTIAGYTIIQLLFKN